MVTVWDYASYDNKPEWLLFETMHHMITTQNGYCLSQGTKIIARIRLEFTFDFYSFQSDQQENSQMEECLLTANWAELMKTTCYPFQNLHHLVQLRILCLLFLWYMLKPYPGIELDKKQCIKQAQGATLQSV